MKITFIIIGILFAYFIICGTVAWNCEGDFHGWLFAPIRFIKRVWCSMIYGHKYKPISPEIQGKQLCECSYCKKRKVI